MAQTTKSLLKDGLNNVAQGNARTRQAIKNVNADLVDSLYNTEVSTQSTIVSASTSFAIPALKIPANSLITEIGFLITETVTCDAGTVGIKGGTTAGGTDILDTDVDALGAAGTEALSPGTGSFLSPLLTTLTHGVDPLSGSSTNFYRASATDLHLTVTTTSGFDGTGEVKGIVKYVKL